MTADSVCIHAEIFSTTNQYLDTCAVILLRKSGLRCNCQWSASRIGFIHPSKRTEKRNALCCNKSRLRLASLMQSHKDRTDVNMCTKLYAMHGITLHSFHSAAKFVALRCVVMHLKLLQTVRVTEPHTCSTHGNETCTFLLLTSMRSCWHLQCPIP